MAVVVNVVGKTDLRELQKAQRELDKLAGSGEQMSSRLGSSLKNVGRVAAGLAAGVAAAGVAIGGALFAVGNEFDQAYDQIRVGTGATGDALEDLKDDFRAVAADAPASFGDVSTAVADLNTRLGLTGEPLQALSGQFLDLARITGEDLSGQIAAGTRLLGDFSIATEDQADALDLVFRASQATGIGVTELSDKMVQFGAPLRQLGFGFAESATLLGKFEREGVNAEAILAGMKSSLGRMARAGEEPIETFGRLSEEIARAGSAGEANAIAVEAFGSRAGPDLAAAIREGRFELDELLGTIEGGTETISGAADDTESFGEKWQRLKNRVLLGLEPIATRVFDAVGDGLDKLTELWADWQPTVERAVQGVQATIERWGPTVVGIFQQVGGVVQTVVGVVTSILDRFRGGIEGNGETVAGWGTRIGEVFAQIRDTVAAGMAAVSAVISTVVSVITEVWDRFGGHLLDFLQRTLGRIIGALSGAFDVIRGIFDVVTGILTGDWSKAWDGIKRAVTGALDLVLNAITQAFDLIKTAFGLAVAVISKVWGDLWDMVVGAVSGAWGAVRDAVGAGVSWVGDKIEETVGFFVGLPGRILGLAGDMLEAGRGLMGALFDGLLAAGGAVGGFVADIGKAVVNGIVDVINRIVIGSLNTALDAVDVAAGPFINIPDNLIPGIPRLAQGGIGLARPGGHLVNIAEGGADEAVIPLPAGWRSDPGSVLGGGQTVNIERGAVQVNVQLAGGEDHRTIRQVVKSAVDDAFDQMVYERLAGAGAS